MRKIFPRIGIFALMFFLVFPEVGSAGPLDQLKNLKIDSKTIMRPATSNTEFQFSNFQLNENTSYESAAWNVDVRISKPIPANLYVVKTLYQNRKGETLLSGEDLVLPEGNQGKTFHLMRPFQKSPGLARITFQVFNQAEGRVAASQTYPLPAYSFLDTRSETASAKHSAPQRTPASSSAIPDKNFDVDFNVDRDTRQIHIHNKNSFPVTINEIAGKARFLAGVDREITVDCKNKKTVQPGEIITCYYEHVVSCPTLTQVDLEAKISGNIHQKTVHYDALIKRIETKKPLVSMERLSKIPQYRDLDWPGATAKIIIRGSYVRIGSYVTIKALASLDSDRFPVVFAGKQEDDGIHAEVTFSGTKTSKPEKFCFNITEITTYDKLSCGGVGVLLYRNDFEYDGVNIFLHKKECK
ncbi:MAG TPA: hypothetical protein PKV75_12540 [Desulfobacterales bacterium]|nr:hypothetical protein [Desulfobacterales bacterium]HPN87692.1 hypothetical protein [Smithella sp.]HQP26028.1 hypothetical protein [Smithellaceae bacterium]